MSNQLMINNVTYNYNDTTKALDDFSTQFSGGIYGFIGRNGAGKTTLLSLIASYMPLQKGEIVLNNDTVYENSQAMESINFVYNRDLSEEDDTVLEYFNSLALYRPNFDKALAEQLMKQFNLDPNKKIYHLSTGMSSVLNVIEGLASKCDITLFDEVHVNMDAVARETFYDALQAANDGQRIFILSTHLVSEMAYLFDHVVMIDKGKKILDDATDEILAKGYVLTGHAEVLTSVEQNYRIIGKKQLGNTLELKLYDVDQKQLKDLKSLDVTVDTITLQDLFVALSKEGNHE